MDTGAFRGRRRDHPFQRFIDDLSDLRFVALDTAIDRVLSVRGIDLVRTEWLEALGEGLHEFRVRHDADEVARMFGPVLMGGGVPMVRNYQDVTAARRERLAPDSTDHREAFEHAYDIAVQVIELRERHGLTQAQLAERCGMDQGDISRIERGSTSPTARTLELRTDGGPGKASTFVGFAWTDQPDGQAQRVVIQAKTGQDAIDELKERSGDAVRYSVWDAVEAERPHQQRRRDRGRRRLPGAGVRDGQRGPACLPMGPRRLRDERPRRPRRRHT